MKLTEDEKAMQGGRDGPAVASAMDLLLRYGAALGAERLVDVRHVAGSFLPMSPQAVRWARTHGGMDGWVSEHLLDSGPSLAIPGAKVFTLQQQLQMDVQAGVGLGTPEAVVEFYPGAAQYLHARGIQPANTCAPYQVGMLPGRGEHCALMESSSVVYCNSVLGARTNAEGRESAGAAMLTGKIPDWGRHRDDGRRGTHLIDVDLELCDEADWGLLGAYIGELVEEGIPVVRRIGGDWADPPGHAALKHLGAAASAPGGVEMIHVVGVTPEAPSVAGAFGGARPLETLSYGAAERRMAFERLHATTQGELVEFVMLGCPHYSLEQIWSACRLLQGRRLHRQCALWIFTARATKALADQGGCTSILEAAGARLMADTCSAMSRSLPPGARHIAVDSAKQARYLAMQPGLHVRFGSAADCIASACAGRWEGAAR